MKALYSLLFVGFLASCGGGIVESGDQASDQDEIFGLSRYEKTWVYPYYKATQATDELIASFKEVNACHMGCSQEFRSWQVRWGTVVLQPVSDEAAWQPSDFLPIQQCGKTFVYVEANTQEECETVFSELPACEWITYVPTCELENNGKWWLTTLVEVFALPTTCNVPVSGIQSFGMEDFPTKAQCEQGRQGFKEPYESGIIISPACLKDLISCPVCMEEGMNCSQDGLDPSALCCPGMVCAKISDTESQCQIEE